jgi:hypothetical protein
MSIPYEQLFIQIFHDNGNLITEQGTGEQDPLFQLASDTMLTSEPHENKTDQHATHNTLTSVPTLPR